MYLERFVVTLLFCFDKSVSNVLIVGQLQEVKYCFLISLYKGQTSTKWYLCSIAVKLQNVRILFYLSILW